MAKEIISLSQTMEKNESITIKCTMELEDQANGSKDDIIFKLFKTDNTIKLGIQGVHMANRHKSIGTKQVKTVHFRFTDDPSIIEKEMKTVCKEYVKYFVREMLLWTDGRNGPFISVFFQNSVIVDDERVIYASLDHTELFNTGLVEPGFELTQDGYDKVFEDIWAYISLSTRLSSVETEVKDKEHIVEFYDDRKDDQTSDGEWQEENVDDFEDTEDEYEETEDEDEDEWESDSTELDEDAHADT